MQDINNKRAIDAWTFASALREMAENDRYTLLDYTPAEAVRGYINIDLELFCAAIAKLINPKYKGVDLSHDSYTDDLDEVFVVLIKPRSEVPRKELCRVFELLRMAGFKPSLEGDYVVARTKTVKSAILHLYEEQTHRLSMMIATLIASYCEE